MRTSFSEIRQLRKKTKTSFYIEFCRDAGLVITWLLIKLAPGISANAVTICMLFMNLGSSFLLLVAVKADSLILLCVSFMLFNFSIFLDCVDGNIARLKEQQSLRGVFLDRLVHNVTYPFLFFASGWAIFNKTGSLRWIALSLLGGVLTELSPIEVALKDVENLFSQQLLGRRSGIYSVKDHIKAKLGSTDLPSDTRWEPKNCLLLILLRIYRLTSSVFPYWNQLFFAIFLDLVLPYPSVRYPITYIYLILFSFKQLFSQIRRVPRGLAAIEDILDLHHQ